MPECKAYGCTNRQGEKGYHGKRFFVIPNPHKEPSLREIASHWLHRIGTGHTVDKFVFHSKQLVCEDHFTEDDFCEDYHIKSCKLMGRQPRYHKALKPGAIPSVFVHRKTKPQDTQRAKRIADRENRKFIVETLDFPNTSNIDIADDADLTHHPFDSSHDNLIQDVDENEERVTGSLSATRRKHNKGISGPNKKAKTCCDNGMADAGTPADNPPPETPADNPPPKTPADDPPETPADNPPETPAESPTRHVATQMPETPANLYAVSLDHTYTQPSYIADAISGIKQAFGDITDIALNTLAAEPEQQSFALFNILKTMGSHISTLSTTNILDVTQKILESINASMIPGPLQSVPSKVHTIESFNAGMIPGPLQSVPSKVHTIESFNASIIPGPLQSLKVHTIDVPSMNDIILNEETGPRCSTPNITLDSSFSFHDDPRDETFVPHECSVNKSGLATDDTVINTPRQVDTDDIGYVCEDKFIVFKSCLVDLIRQIRCKEKSCKSTADDISFKTRGCNLRVKAKCPFGHCLLDWSSQPIVNQMAVGNLLCAGSILYSELTYTRIAAMFNMVNIKFIAASTYNRIQNKYLLPEVQDTWYMAQRYMKTDMATQPLRLSGDGRCDSPGYSAKYLTYTLMDQHSERIIEIQQVQKSETEGSSPRMEKEGYRRAVDQLLEDGLDISIIATDRHSGIRKFHRETYQSKGIAHEFDVYHLANSIKKKIKAKAKRKGYEKLAEWQKAITNHLWWCSATCGGDADLLVEMWKSLAYHITDVHSFPDNQKYKKCPHPILPSTTHGKRKKWMKKDSDVHKALKQVVEDKRLLKDIRHLANFCHTGALEAYHSLILRYAPKRLEFDWCQMDARVKLAALDHNMNLGRKQRIVRNPKNGAGKKGELMFTQSFRRNQGYHVLVPIMERKSHDYLKVMFGKHSWNT